MTIGTIHMRSLLAPSTSELDSSTPLVVVIVIVDVIEWSVIAMASLGRAHAALSYLSSGHVPYIWNKIMVWGPPLHTDTVTWLCAVGVLQQNTIYIKLKARNVYCHHAHVKPSKSINQSFIELILYFQTVVRHTIDPEEDLCTVYIITGCTRQDVPRNMFL